VILADNSRAATTAMINIADATARLPELVDRVSRGEAIAAALEPAKPRMPGHGAGQREIGDDVTRAASGRSAADVRRGAGLKRRARRSTRDERL
jgi:antitoxin (DNA-binding transcriptional repressor) of toxin-antitoxin stability system